MKTKANRIIFYNGDIPSAYLSFTDDGITFQAEEKDAYTKIYVSEKSILNDQEEFTTMCDYFSKGKIKSIVLKAHDRVSDLDCVIISTTDCYPQRISAFVIDDNLDHHIGSSKFTKYAIEWKFDDGMVSLGDFHEVSKCKRRK